MTDVDRKTKTKNIVVRCLRPYKGNGLLREIYNDDDDNTNEEHTGFDNDENIR